MDETQNKQMFPQLAEAIEPMSEVGYHYVGAEILLPRGEGMARDHVVTGRAHTNLILDTRIYQVEFTGGEVTELATNIVVESMYARCDRNLERFG